MIGSERKEGRRDNLAGISPRKGGRKSFYDDEEGEKGGGKGRMRHYRQAGEGAKWWLALAFLCGTGEREGGKGPWSLHI